MSPHHTAEYWTRIDFQATYDVTNHSPISVSTEKTDTFINESEKSLRVSNTSIILHSDAQTL